ncbi:response regulator [Paraliomyxa miuraensis]|uniref:response regulator n=1 Tax=Paraliomyxa miuraensis TaxID=376150 RepID=UPI0022568184|nr:response regulator [Paraliomyxa miuraensis]MCX4239806.1 response regulator [Paraliomyxa miuraensis]
MQSSTPTHSSDYACVRLTFDLDRLPGDHLASIIEEVQSLVGEHVLLTELRSEPVVLEFSGPEAALERLRLSLVQGGLRQGNGRWRMTTGAVCRHSLPFPRRERLVMLVDGDDARSRQDADVLARAAIEPCVVSGADAAVVLLRHSTLPFDAVVLRHHLPRGNGLQVLDRVRAEQRRCSVLVIDDKARPEIARAYRVRGAFRYVSRPEGPVQLVSRVHATILDTQAWRQVEEPATTERDEPPRLLVDPEHAAARLQYVCGLTSTERDVASMVLRGLRDLDIAERLRKSERTAKRYVGKVLEKAGIANRSSLWAVLHQDGLGELSSVSASGLAPAPVDGSERQSSAEEPLSPAPS